MATDSDKIIGLYQRHGLAWAKDRGNRLIEKNWPEHFLGLAPCKASILDLGCGSAEPIARYCIEHGSDWTPLTHRGELFDEDIDRGDPWQFKNFLVD